jgi:hypothetical protein
MPISPAPKKCRYQGLLDCILGTNFKGLKDIFASHAKKLLHFPPRLAKPFGNAVSQFSGGIEQLGHGILTVFARLIRPLAVIFGVMIVVLNPVVQQFDELFRKRERPVTVGMVVMVVMIVMVVIGAMVMIVVIIVVVMMVMVGHLHSPVHLGDPPDPACRRFSQIKQSMPPRSLSQPPVAAVFSIRTCLWKR